MNSEGHEQAYELPILRQNPPFKHGLDEHGLGADKRHKLLVTEQNIIDTALVAYPALPIVDAIAEIPVISLIDASATILARVWRTWSRDYKCFSIKQNPIHTENNVVFFYNY